MADSQGLLVPAVYPKQVGPDRGLIPWPEMRNRLDVDRSGLNCKKKSALWVKAAVPDNFAYRFQPPKKQNPPRLLRTGCFGGASASDWNRRLYASARANVRDCSAASGLCKPTPIAQHLPPARTNCAAGPHGSSDDPAGNQRFGAVHVSPPDGVAVRIGFDQLFHALGLDAVR